MNILAGQGCAASGGGLKGENHLLRAIFEESPLLMQKLYLAAQVSEMQIEKG